MTRIPPPREHDPADRDAEAVDRSARPGPLGRVPYPWTTVYLAVMVTLILLAVLFDWRL